jgi:hypothetical protein
MAVDIQQLTEREQIDVLEAALALIIKPETWVKGQWKCPLYQGEKPGTLVTDKNPWATFQEPARDEKGNPLYAYCLEGAINQAVVDLYGIDRATTLGAYDEYLAESEGEDMGIAVESGTTPTDVISLNELVVQKYADTPIVAAKLRLGETSFAAMNWQDASETTHEQVIALVKKKLGQLRRRVRA